MTKAEDKSVTNRPARFNRGFFEDEAAFTVIGSGAIGGKAQGLVQAKSLIEHHFRGGSQGPVAVDIPRFSVITTEMFDRFMEINNLHEVVRSASRDDEIAHAFQAASLPAELVGDLRGLVDRVHTPLAIRSSSLLEDALAEPFAGVYATKMVPNNQLSPDPRFRTLVEAVKFVYASTFFDNAECYRKATGRSDQDEKMAVIIQEVVGRRHGSRFYPHLSGVARSYNFYPLGGARPEEGVVSLALGLGKQVVDGGRTWTYCPAHPRMRPPFSSNRDLLQQTQTTFWAVNMGKPPAHDPIHETEYLLQGDLGDTERDGILRFLASTYDAPADRIVPGIGRPGPRILNFDPLLQFNEPPVNEVIRDLLKICEEANGIPVEIEFAATFEPEGSGPARLGFLQVRPMFVPLDQVEVTEKEMENDRVIAASTRVLGNGITEDIRDVVYLKPEAFSPKETRAIAGELDQLNRRLLEAGRPYLLIVFGRLGSSDPWLGVPVVWGQVSGARAIVEDFLPQMNVDMSQGSHFFHNIIGLKVFYFSMERTDTHFLHWPWIKERQGAFETQHVRHVELPSPLRIKVDGKRGRGVILR